MQEIGLLGLRLDDRREYRLHVWGPSYSVGEPPVHDHPYDFTSTVVVGEMTNTRYVEDPAGAEYRRVRYTPPDEDPRTTDTVRLSASGDRRAPRVTSTRSSRTSCTTVARLPGTVTIIRMSFRDVPDADRVHAGATRPGCRVESRPATPDEVKTITEAALEQFG